MLLHFLCITFIIPLLGVEGRDVYFSSTSDSVGCNLTDYEYISAYSFNDGSGTITCTTLNIPSELLQQINVNTGIDENSVMYQWQPVTGNVPSFSYVDYTQDQNQPLLYATETKTFTYSDTVQNYNCSDDALVIKTNNSITTAHCVSLTFQTVLAAIELGSIVYTCPSGFIRRSGTLPADSPNPSEDNYVNCASGVQDATGSVLATVFSDDNCTDLNDGGICPDTSFINGAILSESGTDFTVNLFTSFFSDFQPAFSCCYPTVTVLTNNANYHWDSTTFTITTNDTFDCGDTGYLNGVQQLQLEDGTSYNYTCRSLVLDVIPGIVITNNTGTNMTNSAGLPSNDNNTTSTTNNTVVTGNNPNDTNTSINVDDCPPPLALYGIHGNSKTIDAYGSSAATFVQACSWTIFMLLFSYFLHF